jgi:hypothetical protein
MPTEQTMIQIAGNCHPLERRAAKELQRYIRRLFGLEARISTSLPRKGSAFCLGTPDSHSMSEGIRIDPQGFRIRPRRKGSARICDVIGGSPVAVLWGVYAVIEQWGVHYLVHRDVLPETPGRFRLPDRAINRKPLLERRVYRVINDMLNSSASWSLAEHRKVLDQLVKLRFSAIHIATYAHQPWVHWSYRGVHRKHAELLYGFKHPIHERTIGKNLLPMGNYMNPDFRHCVSYEDQIETGKQFMHGLIAAAHQRGLEVILDHNLTDLPQDLKRNLGRWSRNVKLPKASQTTTHPHSLGLARDGGEMRFGHLMTPLNPVYMGMTESWLGAMLDEYPDFDILRLGQLEFPAASAGVDVCWRDLDRRHGISRHFKLKDILAAGRKFKFHSPGRAMLQAKGAIIMIRMLDMVINEHKIVDRRHSADTKILVGFMSHLLMPVVPHIFDPERVEFVATVDYTPADVARRIDTLSFARETPMKIHLITSAEDDNVGFLPQLPTVPMAKLMDGIKKHGVSGYSFRHWLVSKLEPTFGYLIDAAWDRNATTEKSFRRQVSGVCGPRAVKPMLKVFSLLENALVDTDSLDSLGFLMPNLLQKIWIHTLGDQKRAMKRLLRRYEKMMPPLEEALAASESRGEWYVHNLIAWIEFAREYIEVCFRVDKAKACISEALEVRGDSIPFDIERFDLLIIEASGLLDDAVLRLEAAIRIWARHGVCDPSDRATLVGFNVYALDFLRGKATDIRISSEQTGRLVL